MAFENVLTKNDNIDEIKFDVTLNLIDLKPYESNVFFVNGNPWTIKMIQRKSYQNGVEIKSLRFQLFSNITETSENRFIIANLSAKIVSYKFGKPPHQADSASLFHIQNSKWERVIPWNQLIDPENGYLKNDKCKIEIRVKASPLQDVTQNEWLTFETIHCCDCYLNGKFCLTINNIHDFFGVATPKFKLNKSQWQISICRRVLSNNEFLNFRLYRLGSASNAPSKVSVSCKLMSFEPSIGSKHSKVLEYKPLSSQYHSLKLLKWKKLIKPQNRYIQNDSIVIEVDIKVENSKKEPARGKKRPASDETSDATKLVCVICLEGLIGRSISSLSCGHMFCTVCIENSLKQREQCPTCNQNATQKQVRKVFLPMT